MQVGLRFDGNFASSAQHIQAVDASSHLQHQPAIQRNKLIDTSNV